MRSPWRGSKSSRHRRKDQRREAAGRVASVAPAPKEPPQPLQQERLQPGPEAAGLRMQGAAGQETLAGARGAQKGEQPNLANLFKSVTNCRRAHT